MSDYDNLHARISQLVERNTGLGNELDRLNGENALLRANANLHKLSMDSACYEIQEMRKEARLLDVLAEAMAEIKAASDGESDQPIADIISGCLAEIAAISSPENPS